MNQSALVVVVPEAEPLVGALRARFDPSALIGMSAHITILFPFMPVERLTPDILEKLGTVVGSYVEFEFRLEKIGRFPQTTYLAPEPPEPFAAITAALAREFPAYPPYAGRFPATIPHLTVADQNEAFAEAAAFELAEAQGRRGGIQATCRAVMLLENSQGGRWRDYDSFMLKRRA
jgi:2'-5' RNA ligase